MSLKTGLVRELSLAIGFYATLSYGMGWLTALSSTPCHEALAAKIHKMLPRHDILCRADIFMKLCQSKGKKNWLNNYFSKVSGCSTAVWPLTDFSRNHIPQGARIFLLSFHIKNALIKYICLLKLNNGYAWCLTGLKVLFKYVLPSSRVKK